MSITTTINARTMSAAEFLASVRGMEGGAGLAPRRAFYDRYAAFAQSMGYRYTYELVAWLEINEPDVAAAVSFIGDLDDEFYDGVADLFEDVPDDIADRDDEALRIVRAASAVRSEMLGRAARGDVAPADAMTPHAAALAVVEAAGTMQALEFMDAAASYGVEVADMQEAAEFVNWETADDLAYTVAAALDTFGDDSIELLRMLVEGGSLLPDAADLPSAIRDLSVYYADSVEGFAQLYAEEVGAVAFCEDWIWAAIDWSVAWDRALRHDFTDWPLRSGRVAFVSR